MPVDEHLTEVARSHYEIQDELARGGMGRILIARDRRIGRTVALKELLGSDDALFRRFEREALVTGRLQHPAIVPVYEAGRWPSGEPFFAMKLVKGRSLDKVILEKENLNQRIALLPTIIQIAEALAYAHSEQVIHRDLKPQNVLVGAYGETVVVDWGLAKDMSDGAAESLPAIQPSAIRSPATSGDLTMAGSVMGTPTYMPVEQARGLALDERCDVYALGAILYHALAGKPPYSGRSADDILDQVNEGPPPAIASVAPGVPEELAAIVDKAMARSLADRYRTATQLAAELTAFQAGQLVAAHRYSRWDLIKRFARRHRAALSAAAALMLIGGAIAIISVRQVVSARDEARAALATVEREKRAFLVEEGRQELVAAKTTKAATLLAEAYRSGDPDDYTRMLLAHAMRPIDATIARIETAPVHDLGALAGDRFVAVDDNEQITVWTLDGKLLEKPELAVGHTIAISQDGTLFAFQAATTIEVVRASDLTRAAKLEIGDLEVQTVAFSPDATRVYAVAGNTGKDTGELLAWNLPDRTPRKLALDVAADVVVSLAVLSNGTVYAQTQEAGVRVIAADLAKAEKLPGESVRASADGSHVAFGINREERGTTLSSIGVFPTASLAEPAATISNAAVEFMIDRHGKRILQLPNAVTDAVLCEVTKGDRHEPLARISGVLAALSPDGTRIATTDDNHVIRIWDDLGEVLAVWPGHQRAIKSLTFSPDGKSLISGGEDGVRTWRITAPDMVRLPVTGLSEAAGGSDGKYVIALADRSAILVDVATGTRVRELASGPSGMVWSAAMSPDGTRLVTTSSDGHLTVWDVASGNRVTAVDVYAWSAMWSPDGRRIVTAGDVDGHVFDAATGADTVLDGADLVRSARFSADGGQVITGAADGVARIYDARTGALIIALRGHTDYLIDARFDATGARAITASADRAARLWDLHTAATVATLQHPSAVLAAEISPTGDRILTVARDGGRVWDAFTAHQVAALGGTSDQVVGGKFIRGGAAIATLTRQAALIWDTSRGAPLFALPARPPPSRIATIQMEAAIAPETVDPRARAAELIELPGDRIAFARDGRVTVHGVGREQRSAAAIAQLIETRGDWRIVDGGVVPSRDLIEVKAVDAPVTLDLGEDAITGSVLRPELEVRLPTDRTGITVQILSAKQAADAGKRSEARTLLAGLPDHPAAPREVLYVLAWLRHDTGDDAAAFSALRSAATMPGWRVADTRTLARELAQFATAADLSFDDTLAAMRATSKMTPLELLTQLDDIYRSNGQAALEQRVLAELAPLVPRDKLATLEVRQARHALDGGDPRALRRFTTAALEHLPATAEAATIRKDVVDLAGLAVRHHDATKDESFLRAAHKILRAARRATSINDPQAKPITDWLTEVEHRIASAGMALPTVRKDRIREVVRARLARLRRCYERGLVRDPKLAGSVTFRFVIVGSKPAQVEVATSLLDRKVESCLVGELSKLTFPRARDAGKLEVRYPISFKPD